MRVSTASDTGAGLHRRGRSVASSLAAHGDLPAAQPPARAPALDLPRPGAPRRRGLLRSPSTRTGCRPTRTSTRTPTWSPASCWRRPARRASCRRTPTPWWGRCGSAPPEGRFYPKYPLGQPLLVAAAIKAFGLAAAFLVNPLLMTLALLGVFLLVREAVGSAGGPAGDAGDGDEPGAARRDQRSGQPRRLARLHRLGDVPAAALVAHREAPRTRRSPASCSATRRSSATPRGCSCCRVALVALFRLGRQPERGESAAPSPARPLLAGWGGCCRSPARSLSICGRCTASPATTPPTRAPPSRTAYFAHNWRLTVRQLFTLGLPLLLPLAVLGLAAPRLARERRLGLVLWAWPLPNLLLYIVLLLGARTTSTTSASSSPSSRRWCWGWPGC